MLFRSCHYALLQGSPPQNCPRSHASSSRYYHHYRHTCPLFITFAAQLSRFETALCSRDLKQGVLRQYVIILLNIGEDTPIGGNMERCFILTAAETNSLFVFFLCVNSSREEGVGGYTNQVVAYPYWTWPCLYRLPAVQQDCQARVRKEP